MPPYLFHPKPEKTYFGPTYGSRYGPKKPTRSETLKQILTYLHILGPPPPPSTEISWYQEDLPLSKVQKAAPLLVIGSTHDPSSTTIELTATELARLHELRAELWAVCPDPWVERWTFLNPGLSHIAVAMARSRAIVADIGRGVGLDLRQLANDADVGPGNFYAVDSRPAIWDIEENLFGVDEKIQFLNADMVDGLDITELGYLKWKVDIIVACYIIDQSQHTDRWDTLQRLAELSHVGTWLIGYTLGAIGKDVTVRSIFQNDYGYRFCHDSGSFARAWGTVFNRTETMWEFETLETTELEEVGWDRGDAKFSKC